MELKQLRYFIAVADELHFGRAAKRLHISQPALSFDIRKFEDQLGVTLFTRSSKHVALTTAGQLLRERAQNVLHQASEAEQLMQQSARGIVGRLNVGFVNSMLFRGLPEAVEAFSLIHPDIEVVMWEMNTQEQLKALSQQRIDLGCAHAMQLPDNIACKQLLSEPFVCCIPNKHRLAGSGRIALAELADAAFICFPRYVSPHYHDRIIALCVAAGFSPHIRHEVRLWQTVITMVEHNMGVALVPQSLCVGTSSTVWFRPLEGDAGTSELQILQRHDHPSVGATEFAATLTQNVRQKSRAAAQHLRASSPQ